MKTVGLRVSKFCTRVGGAGSVLRKFRPVAEDRLGPPYHRKRGFTLLETVLSLAVFAIIVVPAIGLVALSYRNVDTEAQAPNAVEIKSLLEIELRGAAIVDVGAGPSGTDLVYDVFHNSFLSSDVIFYASRDLDKLEQDGASMADSEKYYKVTVTTPTTYTYDDDDPYRLFLFNIIWPAFVPDSVGGFVDNEDNAEALQQLVIPVILNK